MIKQALLGSMTVLACSTAHGVSLEERGSSDRSLWSIQSL